jgi:glutathione S-transferase
MYDLVGADGRGFSPYCWRTRMAIAHKGLDIEIRPTRFTDIPRICGGGLKTVPVIEDRGQVVADSLTIAEYLESSYPDGPSLFGGSVGHSLSAFAQAWAGSILRNINQLVTLDTYNSLDVVDRPYFRESRERRHGLTLERMQAGREQRLPEIRNSLQPLRQLLGQQPWIGGDRPLDADYIVFGIMQWVRVISDLQLLEIGDPIAQWFDRCLALYDGLGRRTLP